MTNHCSKNLHCVHLMKVMVATAMIAIPLSACVSDSVSTPRPELVLDGDERNYAAFEAAAKACSYSSYKRFPGAKIEGSVEIGPHYNLLEVETGSAKCVLRWIDAHPELGFQVGSH